MTLPDVEPSEFVSYPDLKQNIVEKMKSGGDGIKDCFFVNRALELARIYLIRSPGIPDGFDVIGDIDDLSKDILTRHQPYCKKPFTHPPASSR